MKVVFNQYRMTVSQQSDLQRQAMANNIHNRITALPDLRLEQQKTLQSQIQSKRSPRPSPNVGRKESTDSRPKFSNSLTVGPGMSRSSSLKEPRLKQKVGRKWTGLFLGKHAKYGAYGGNVYICCEMCSSFISGTFICVSN